MNTFNWLVKREYWENRGGFLWAPVIVGGIAILFTIAAALAGIILANQHEDEIASHVIVDADYAAGIGGIGDIALASGAGMTMIVLAFVLFFYALGSLYDDRRDKSILFWKSMPITDLQMVLSKAAWAIVLAPLMALGIGILVGLAFWVLYMVTSAIAGVPGAGHIVTESHPFKVVATLLVALPVQMLWALPTLGWLMLCSAWAKRLPFLWATAIPVLGCLMISFTDIFPGIEINHEKLWYTGVYRGLFSILPGSWIPTIAEEPAHFDGPQDVSSLVDITSSWQLLGNVDVWIGAAIGIAMIALAVRLRRWRDEG